VALPRNFRIQDRSKLVNMNSAHYARPRGPLGDVFIDTVNRAACKATLDRFVRALFGNNEITPNHDEYGMYMAKSASLRSAALTRQVGAAVFRETGELLTMGCNEVPKAGGGTYWGEDPQDHRDIIEGYDPNEKKKIELLVDFIDRLNTKGYLSPALVEKGNSYDICQQLLKESHLSLPPVCEAHRCMRHPTGCVHRTLSEELREPAPFRLDRGRGQC
jgi:deoxycytidylate deaminase